MVISSEKINVTEFDDNIWRRVYVLSVSIREKHYVSVRLLHNQVSNSKGSSRSYCRDFNHWRISLVLFLILEGKTVDKMAEQ